ncbi:hypothetical protein ACFMBG_10290 [Leisingera sp. D0M16]|uniref:hypothetical protein n=1 Tax=Leisingera coralii TaxID=3351347 RepID=UPI003B7A244B
MLWKDVLRITSLASAIAAGLLVQGARHANAPEADSVAGQAEGIKPVQVETVTLPEFAARNA